MQTLKRRLVRHGTLKRFKYVAVLSFSRFKGTGRNRIEGNDVIIPPYNLKNLQMTLTPWGMTKTEKYFLHIKLISVASTPRKVKFQVSNSFDIASIYSTYLNSNFNFYWIKRLITDLSFFIRSSNYPMLTI